MPLNYLKLNSSISQMADFEVGRRDKLSDRLTACRAMRETYAEKFKELQEIVAQAQQQNKNLRCAEPISEALNAHFAAPQIPTQGITVLSGDGSQITPNPHEAVFYGVVNVGLFEMCPGSGAAPKTQTFTELIYDEGQLGIDQPITEDLVNLLRDASERTQLAKYAASLPQPLIVLTDGPLELYQEPRQNPNFRRYFDNYLDALKDLSQLQRINAGYVDRPRAHLLVKLLELASGAPAEEHPFAGLTDLALIEDLLQPGERSAIFKLVSSASQDFTGRLELHFFYLNVGSLAHPALARVDFPAWVLDFPSGIDQLHAVLLDQARMSGEHPYPYVLVRAHETAVVRLDEAEALKNMIQRELLQRGLPTLLDSEKLANKKIGWRTRY
jgi:hypothetical protein